MASQAGEDAHAEARIDAALWQLMVGGDAIEIKAKFKPTIALPWPPIPLAWPLWTPTPRVAVLLDIDGLEDDYMSRPAADLQTVLSLAGPSCGITHTHCS
jgi:hypothetical protein